MRQYAAEKTEAGETLLEIILAVVLIGLIVSTYFATYSTSALATTSQRDLVAADGLLRNFAESYKGAVRDDCVPPTTFSPTPVSIPANFSVSVTPSTLTCPSATVPRLITIEVTTPAGIHKDLSVELRSP